MSFILRVRRTGETRGPPRKPSWARLEGRTPPPQPVQRKLPLTFELSVKTMHSTTINYFNYQEFSFSPKIVPKSRIPARTIHCLTGNTYRLLIWSELSQYSFQVFYIEKSIFYQCSALSHMQDLKSETQIRRSLFHQIQPCSRLGVRCSDAHHGTLLRIRLRVRHQPDRGRDTPLLCRRS